MTRGAAAIGRIAAAFLGLVCGIWLANDAAGQSAARRVTIGYLEIADDPRYEEIRRYTGLRLKVRKRPLAGALLALRESRVVARALKVEIALEKASGGSAAELVSAIRRLRAEKEARFFIIDASAEVLSEIAAASRDIEVLLFNVSEPADELRRAGCDPRMMHVIPSRAMLTDGLAQYLVWKGWKNILVLEGPLPEDAAVSNSFQRSAKKFGARIVAVKDFVLGNDPRNRDRNNIALLTSAPSHDVVFLADTQVEFGRYVPYQTSHARPVVGTEGLVAAPWHWTWERHGAPQLNQRFEKRAGRRMQGADWAAWEAVKSIVQAMAHGKSADFRDLAAALKSAELTLDAYKGTPANFRPWNNQLRQPILLHTNNAVVARAPLPGFLHPVNDLDTLGIDAPESACHF